MILLLIGTVGFLSSLWTGAVTAGVWTAAVLVIHAIIITKCRQFLAERRDDVDIRAWRLRFIMLDLFFGLAWMFNLIASGRRRRRLEHLHAVRDAAGGRGVEHAGVEPADRGVRRDRAGDGGGGASTSRCAATCTTTSSPPWR